MKSGSADATSTSKNDQYLPLSTNDAEQERRHPWGVGGLLSALAFSSMIVVPMFLMDNTVKAVSFYEKLVKASGPSESMLRFLGIVIFLNHLFLIAAFLSGYYKYTGSHHGRGLAAASYGLMMLAVLVTPGLMPAPRVPDRLFCDTFLPLVFLLYLLFSRRVKHTYKPNGSHLPLRTNPVRSWEKGLLIVWGALLIVASTALAWVMREAIRQIHDSMI